MPQIETKIIYKDLSYTLNGLFFKVHNDLGRFRNEKIYADYLEKLLIESNIKYARETSIEPSFEGEKVGRNRPDFIIEDKIIIDLKAKNMISKEDYFQMKRYLDSSKKRLGIIVNFRSIHIYPKRVAN